MYRKPFLALALLLIASPCLAVAGGGTEEVSAPAVIVAGYLPVVTPGWIGGLIESLVRDLEDALKKEKESAPPTTKGGPEAEWGG